MTRVAIEKINRYTKKEIGQGVENLINNLGGLRSLIPPYTKKILIKPNLAFPRTWDTGATINLDVLTKIVNMIKKLGIEIVIGEGAGWGQSSQEAFEVTGITKLVKELKVPLYDFKCGKDIEIKIPNGDVKRKIIVDKVVLECDYIISLAKFKTHCETVVSLSLKNMKGLISRDKERLAFHLLDVNRCLVDINRIFKPNLAIVEGLIGLEGIGPWEPGKPIDLGLLIGGSDAVAVDATCVKIMRFDPNKVKHIRLASEAGLGVIDSKKIKIVGKKLEEVTPSSFEMPPMTIKGISPYKKVKVIAGSPCSNCVIALASYLHGFLPRKIAENACAEVNILIGAKARPKGKGFEIALGNCLRRYKDKMLYISGCPPASDTYLDIVEKVLSGKYKKENLNE